jgi:hypothetical protein
LSLIISLGWTLEIYTPYQPGLKFLSLPVEAYGEAASAAYSRPILLAPQIVPRRVVSAPLVVAFSKHACMAHA